MKNGGKTGGFTVEAQKPLNLFFTTEAQRAQRKDFFFKYKNLFHHRGTGAQRKPYIC
jgi:hypothetical protein